MNHVNIFNILFQYFKNYWIFFSKVKLVWPKCWIYGYKDYSRKHNKVGAWTTKNTTQDQGWTSTDGVTAATGTSISSLLLAWVLRAWRCLGRKLLSSGLQWAVRSLDFLPSGSWIGAPYTNSFYQNVGNFRRWATFWILTTQVLNFF